LAGRLVRPGDPLYGAARTVYDLRWDGAEPAAIAYCASNADVQRAVDFSRRPPAGADPAVRRAQLRRLLDRVGADHRRQSARPGRGRGPHRDRRRRHPSGRPLQRRRCRRDAGARRQLPTVGVAGLALGGGNGVLGRRYGLTADAIESLTIVTADASVLAADPAHHADLHWASQGGAGATSAWSRRSASAPSDPAAGAVHARIPVGPRRRPARGLGDWIGRAPDELWSNLQLLSAGPAA